MSPCLEDPNANELAILRLLAGGAAPASWLARELGLDRSYLTRNLKVMALCGYVVTARVPDGCRNKDRRQRWVELTPVGRDVARSVQEEETQRVSESLRECSTHEQRRLLRCMRLMRATLQARA